MKTHNLIIFLLFITSTTFTQNITLDYINKYHPIAQKEMQRTGIPASITLAQGILESGSGTSKLATKANNHFGIKCHGWEGKKIYHDDDRRNECFRKYPDVINSYIDHSDFLTSGQRYQFLFNENVSDYKFWAKGLKQAGYATNRKYDQLLIDLIEKYKLYEYDDITYTPAEKQTSIKETTTYTSVNHVKAYIAPHQTTISEVANETGKFIAEIAKYNEWEKDRIIEKGETVYLQPKRKKANRKHQQHIVNKGETIASIAHLYGIKQSALLKLNLLSDDSAIMAGQKLSLRKQLKGTQPEKTKTTSIKKPTKESKISPNKVQPTQKKDDSIEFIFEE